MVLLERSHECTFLQLPVHSCIKRKRGRSAGRRIPSKTEYPERFSSQRSPAQPALLEMESRVRKAQGGVNTHESLQDNKMKRPQLSYLAGRVHHFYPGDAGTPLFFRKTVLTNHERREGASKELKLSPIWAHGLSCNTVNRVGPSWVQCEWLGHIYLNANSGEVRGSKQTGCWSDSNKNSKDASIPGSFVPTPHGIYEHL